MISLCVCTYFKVLLIELFEFILSAKIFSMLHHISKNIQTKICDLCKVNASCFKRRTNMLLQKHH